MMTAMFVFQAVLFIRLSSMDVLSFVCKKAVNED